MLSLECNFTYTLLVLSHIHTQIEKPKWKVYTNEVYDQNNCSWFRRGSTAGEDSASSRMYFLTATEQVHVSFEPSNHKSLLCEEVVQHLNSILVKRLLHLVPIQISLVSLNIGSYLTFLGCPAVADRYHVHIYNAMSLYIQSHLKSLIWTLDNPNQRTKDLKRSRGVYCDKSKFVTK